MHATGQVVSFRAERIFPIEKLGLAMNAALPEDVSVREAAIVPGRFSARFDAQARTYEYLILNRAAPSAVLRRWTHHVHRPIDDGALLEAAGALRGRHDFAAFCGVRPELGGTERTLRSIELEREGQLVRLRLVADGFLHRMVRVICGTLIEIATGRRDPGDIAVLLEGKDRTRAGYTAPASGLFLAGVRYADFDSYARPLTLGPRSGLALDAGSVPSASTPSEL